MKGKPLVLRRILAANLKEHRRSLNLSQEKLAEIAGLSWQTINSIECHRTWVSDKTLENLADALKIEAFRLLLPLLPMAGVDEKPMSSEVAIRELLRVKRAYDDSFNEIVNLTKKAEKNG
ncbi:MAG: helix-turn-helix domain-containing protein [Treponema sp.]|nr:helix-turn-helix domain-containing protein [Treponema sp.]